MALKNFKLFRGNSSENTMQDYSVSVDEGMVVLDAIRLIQAEQEGDVAVRWKCKAGKCGSGGVERNGEPKLDCMTRINEDDDDENISVRPIKTFPVIKDLVTDVSWNYEQNKKIASFKPDSSKKDENGNYIMMQEDIDRVQEFRKCIECYLCQNVCHVLRDHEHKEKFIGPRFMIRLASLEMHPLDKADRIPDIKNEHGSGMCNITRCCTDVCPEHIQITDNGIIPLKERVVDRYYDPIFWVFRKLFKKKK